jgi:hypothetical protein
MQNTWPGAYGPPPHLTYQLPPRHSFDVFAGNYDAFAGKIFFLFFFNVYYFLFYFIILFQVKTN